MTPTPRLLAAIAAALVLQLAAAQAETGLDHDLKVSLDPESRALRVEDRFTVEPGAPIALRLAPWLDVIEARVDGEPVPATRTGELVRLAAPASRAREVALLLEGSVPALPAPETEDAPAVPLADAMADPQGSYLPDYANWMADRGEALIRYRLTLEVPAPYRAVANGRLIEDGLEGGIYRAVFAAEEPAERPSILAGPYAIAERLEEGLRIRTYFHPEAAPLADAYLESAAGFLARYADEIGAYPFADFHIVSAPLPVGLGLPGMTYVSRRILPLPFMRGRSLAHEILHSWWGNGVRIDHATGNWAEGLTAYMADYALAEDASDQAAREMRLAWLQNFAALPAALDLPVVRFAGKRKDASQVVGYDKVAFIFHMLKRELGEAAFADGLRRFWREMRFEVAAWSDLQRAFETASGRDLEGFFDQWLRRAGAPRVELLEAARAVQASGHRLTLRLRQGSPPYRIRLPLVIETAGGASRQDVVLEEPEQSFELAVAGRPTAVRIDPDFEAFRRLLPGESPPIFRDVTLAPDTLLVVPTEDAEVAGIARRLAGRMLQREPRFHTGSLPDQPALVIGMTADIDDLLGPSGSALEIAGQGTARAWVEQRENGPPRLLVAADDLDALAALQRPLPHYRRHSYVVFEGSKATAKGLWPVPASPLSRVFGD